MARDNQRARVYDAEFQVRHALDVSREQETPSFRVGDSTLTLPLEVRFGSLEGVMAYLDRLYASEQFRAAFGTRQPPSIHQRQGNAKAHALGNSIHLYDHERRGVAWSMRELVVLHECAHILARSGHGIIAVHGPEFCGTFIRLVRIAMGGEVALLLMQALHGAGCRVDYAQAMAA